MQPGNSSSLRLSPGPHSPVSSRFGQKQLVRSNVMYSKAITASGIALWQGIMQVIFCYDWVPDEPAAFGHINMSRLHCKIYSNLTTALANLLQQNTPHVTIKILCSIQNVSNHNKWGKTWFIKLTESSILGFKFTLDDSAMPDLCPTPTFSANAGNNLLFLPESSK